MPMLHSLCSTMFVPSTDEFTVGKGAQRFDGGADEERHEGQLGAGLAARISLSILARSAAMPLMSTSSTE